MNFEDLKETDREVYEFIGKEIDRQRNSLELIPSENFVSKAVMQAQGSVLTNKYAVGDYIKIFPRKIYGTPMG